MLVVGRKEGESIMIGEDIVITVCQIKKSNYVRIGIEAPTKTPVHRKEVFEAIKRDGLRKKT